MRRMRCLTAAVVTMVAVGAWAGPASAPVDPDGHHWSSFRWGTITHPTRYFFVYDRSSDPAVSAATQQMVAALDHLWWSFPALPYPIYLADHANNGACGQFTRPDASFMTVCSGDPGGDQVATVSWGVGLANHVMNPWVIVRPGLDANTAFTTVCGMISRTLGLARNPAPDSCLNPVITLGELRGLNGADLGDLLRIYYSHYPN